MSETNPSPAVSAEHFYEIIRGQVEHEDNLIGQRLSWFVTAQSFLFTAYAITIANVGQTHPAWAGAQMRRLYVLIPVVAILMCLLIGMGVTAGLIAMGNLHRLYLKFFGPAADRGFPPVQGFRRTQVLGRAPPLLIPILFLIVWTILLVIGG